MEQQDKIPIPKPDEIFTALINPSDIDMEMFKGFQTLAESNVDALTQEINRRKKLDDLKSALENEDFDLLRETYKDMYGEDMISAGKQLFISVLALRGLRVEDEVHVEETVGEWIENTYEDYGISGVLKLTEAIDTALQVADEYQVRFDSEVAKQQKKDKNYQPEYTTVRFSDMARRFWE